MRSKKMFTIGCDPEVFIVNAKGEPVSAAGIIPGSKDYPHPLEGGSCHPDGMAAEFGITPCTTFSQFHSRIEGVMSQMKTFLPEGYKFSITPFVRFSEDEFAKADEVAKALGCIPDYNAWTGEMNPVPNMDNDPFLRTASGHVHVGFPGGPYDLADEQHIATCRDFVQQCDWFLGAWSLRHDSDPTRRSLYGKAGAYRPKTYGVEYRVMSNFWLVNANRMRNVWDRVQSAIGAMQKYYMPDRALSGDNEYLVEQINSGKLDRDFSARYSFPLIQVM